MDEVKMSFAGITTVVAQRMPSCLQATMYINLMCIILVHFKI